MSFPAEMSYRADISCLSPHELVDEFRSPACLVADDGQSVLSFNGETLALLEKLHRDRSGFSAGEDSTSLADRGSPVSTGALSLLTETLGAPRVWSLSVEGRPCFIYLFPDHGSGKEKAAGGGPVPSKRDKDDELERLLVRNSMVVTGSPLVLFQGELRERFFLNYVSENVAQFGYHADELINRNFPLYSLIHPDDLDKVPKKAARDRSEGMDREYLFRMRDLGGEYHWMSLRDRILPGKDGDVDKVVGVILDVTDRKEAEIALRDSHEEMRVQFLQLQAAWEQTIELLAGVTELRDPYTMGHQRRVAHLAGALAGEMGLGEDCVQEVIRAGLVHDIGKIQIPAEFLSKPGKLTEREFVIIREHPTIGSNLLKTIDLPWPLSDIVLQHHERMDGSGYPQGLKGNEILPAARILAVADVVEAMASHRPYRPALGIGKALTEVTNNAGRLYDAEVVAVCRNLFLEKGYNLSVL